MFTSEMEDLSQNLADFLLQRLGGACYYSDRKGFPALIDRHCHFEVSRRSAEKWLDHMELALEDMHEDIQEKDR